MMTSNTRIRLYVDHTLAQGQSLSLNCEHAHYLFKVMRLGEGDELMVFNGRDGEWRARVLMLSKRAGQLIIAEQTRPLQMPPDLWLVFAPIKKARTDFIVEKATEMGVRQIVPVQTQYTNTGRIAIERLQAHAIEAAEQCGGTYVPKITPLERLNRVIQSWPAERSVLFCDEMRAGTVQVFPVDRGPWAIFIGPEGGFSHAERTLIEHLPNSHPISLGPRILRADTAAVAAISLWQFALGDWR